ncbi:MAG: hypothetical protein EAZ06_10235 [Cytophagales bacterium]|nr:MAG: hypothetical protein EAZ06_10235 [Cytophagales bacterium]
MLKIYASILCIVLVSGCASIKKPLQIPASMSSCVISEKAYLMDSLTMANASKFNYDTTEATKILPVRFTNRSITMARDLNLYGHLCEYTRLEIKNQNSPPSADFIALRQDFYQRIRIAEDDIITNLAELDCEKTRILSLTNYLANYNQTRTNRATINAILAGSLTAIIAGTAGLIDPDSTNTIQQVSTIVGAVASAYYSFRAFGTKKKIIYLHARNHLREVWQRNLYSQIYSPSVWNFMCKVFRSKGKTSNGLDVIKEKWQQEDLLDEKDKNYKDKVQLLMGNGGDYSLDDLQNRLNMLVVIESEIDLMKYDLKRLQQEMMIGQK